MDTNFLKENEKLLVWLFEHEEEFIKKFLPEILDNNDSISIYMSSQYILVLIYDLVRPSNKVIPILEVIDWVNIHSDGY